MCHIKPEVSYLIPGSLEDTVNTLKLRTDITSQQKKSQVRIKMCDDNGNPFIATLHNVILAPDLCDNLFSIIALMNLGYTCLFHKGFSTVNFGAKKNGAVTLRHSAQKKHSSLGKIKEMSKKNKLPARKKIAL